MPEHNQYNFSGRHAVATGGGIGVAIAHRLSSDDCPYTSAAVFNISGGRATY
jgi:hypothetical protein